MPPTQIVPGLADSFRDLADFLDQVPMVEQVKKYQHAPIQVVLIASTGMAVELLGIALDTPTATSVRENEAHTALSVVFGQVELRVVALEPVERELRRPSAVHPADEDMEP